MTIIEMIVAIGIFTLGMIGATLLFTHAWQANSFSLEMGQSTSEVSQTMNKILDYIREASQSDNGSYPIVSANDNDLVLYSDYNNDGKVERLHFYKSGQDILMGITAPTDTMPVAYPSGDQQTITLADHIVNDSNSPVFYYYDNTYAGGSGQNPLPVPASVSDIRLIKVHLYINIDPNRAPDNIELQSFAELRNLNDNNQAQ